MRGAFENTWKGSASIRKERLCLTDIQVLTIDATSATATCTYHWEGNMAGEFFRVHGRGTQVLVIANGRLQIIHEHLSRYPSLGMLTA